VGLLFWPRNSYRELQSLDQHLLADLQGQLERYQAWMDGQHERPAPLNTAPLTGNLMRMTDLVERERRGPRQKRLRELLPVPHDPSTPITPELTWSAATPAAAPTAPAP
jgi:hypothetical protein